jgi:hypothetical protein
MQGTAGERYQDLCNHFASWGALAASSGGVYDSFTRVVAAGGWGAADVGGTWTVVGTAADFSDPGTLGQIAVSVVNSVRRATLGSTADGQFYLELAAGPVATGAPYRLGWHARAADASNYYLFVLEFGLAGVVTPRIIKRVAGVETTLISGTAGVYVAGQPFRLHVSLVGTTLAMSGWAFPGANEPVIPQISFIDASLAAASPFGPYALLTTGLTNGLPVTVSFDNIQYLAAPTWTQVLDGAVA